MATGAGSYTAPEQLGRVLKRKWNRRSKRSFIHFA
jgi:hypothetical protein